MWIAILLFAACETEDPYADWDTAGWDAEGDWNANGTGQEEEASDPVPTGDSCSFGDTVCIAASEPDNEAWCTGLSGIYSADSCATGYDGYCALPVGGDFTSYATAYYYDNSDPQGACEGGGGIYTAATGS